MRTGIAVILGLCFVVAAGVFGSYFLKARAGDNDIRVVGSASRQFESDVIKWRITLGRATSLTDAQSGYAALRRDRDALSAYLTSSGIRPAELATQPVNRAYTYDNDGRATGYSFTQTFDVVSPSIDTVEKLALNPDALYEQGVGLQYSGLEYYLSRLPEVKRELLAEAMRDAKARAEEMARNSGVRIGRLRAARAGVFQITEPYSTEVSDYGIYSTATRQKNVTVTVTANFSLR